MRSFALQGAQKKIAVASGAAFLVGQDIEGANTGHVVHRGGTQHGLVHLDKQPIREKHGYGDGQMLKQDTQKCRCGVVSGRSLGSSGMGVLMRRPTLERSLFKLGNALT
jgi:hypothetical protein